MQNENSNIEKKRTLLIIYVYKQYMKQHLIASSSNEGADESANLRILSR